MATEVKKKRICIVGCGPAGMSALYHFSNLPDEEKPEIVCYEKQSTWGGMWNVTWRTSTDEYGEPVHACMYFDLWTNNPKEMTEYPDYTFEKHFGKAVPSFVPGPVLKDYIEGRVTRGRKNKPDLHQHVKFSTVVRWIDYHKETDDFLVKAKNLKEDQDIEERFTHVIVATGMFGHPNMPEFPGLDSFQVKVMHAKEVRRAKVFRDKKILLIGSSFSALDLTLQFIKHGATQVIISYQKRPTGMKLPTRAEERPIVTYFNETSAYFKDGTEAAIDVVIFCTGYRHHHPFLPENLRIKPDMNIYPSNLYKGIVWMKDGNMKFLYLGVLYTTYFLTILDVQAVWVCQFIMRQDKPSVQEMIADIAAYTTERDKVVATWEAPDILKFVKDYIVDLIEATGYQLDFEKAEAILLEHIKNVFDDPSTYRDKQFRSVFTDQQSAAPAMLWMKDFRDVSEIV